MANIQSVKEQATIHLAMNHYKNLTGSTEIPPSDDKTGKRELFSTVWYMSSQQVRFLELVKENLKPTDFEQAIAKEISNSNLMGYDKTGTENLESLKNKAKSLFPNHNVDVSALENWQQSYKTIFRADNGQPSYSDYLDRYKKGSDAIEEIRSELATALEEVKAHFSSTSMPRLDNDRRYGSNEIELAEKAFKDFVKNNHTTSTEGWFFRKEVQKINGDWQQKTGQAVADLYTVNPDAASLLNLHFQQAAADVDKNLKSESQISDSSLLPCPFGLNNKEASAISNLHNAIHNIPQSMTIPVMQIKIDGITNTEIPKEIVEAAKRIPEGRIAELQKMYREDSATTPTKPNAQGATHTTKQIGH